MAFSYTQEIGDGVTTSYTFSFAGQDEGYIRESDIVALVDGVETPFTLTSSNTLEFSSAPANGAIIRIRRVMPKNLPYSDFSRGNNFGPDVLNNSFLQSLYIIHEALDGWFPEGFQFLTTVGFADDVNFNGFDINDAGTLTAEDIVIGPLSLSAEGILTEAYNWAQYPVDQLVPEGNGIDEYSSYHHSVKAEGSADAAAISEGNAAASESAAATSASNAATSEANALASEQAAAASESNAATSEANALASEQAAATSESNAATSASNAANSASAAATSETNAANSASAAATSETNAATSASNALASENKAEEWADKAEDVEVEPGRYSAKHWSEKAEAWATVASQRYLFPEDYATLQLAVTDAVARDMPLLLDGDTYNITSTISATISDNNGLRIIGNGSTISGNFAGPLIEVNGSGEIASRLEIRGLLLSNPSGQGIGLSGDASAVTGTRGWGIIEDIDCAHGQILDYLIHAVNWRHVNFRDITGKAGSGNSGGVFIQGDGNFAGDMNFHGCEFASDGTGRPFYVNSDNNGEARGIHLVDSYIYGPRSLIDAYNGALSADIFFTGVQWDAFTGGIGLTVDTGTTGNVDNVVVSNFYFQQSDSMCILLTSGGGNVSNCNINNGVVGGVNTTDFLFNCYRALDVGFSDITMQSCSVGTALFGFNQDNRSAGLSCIGNRALGCTGSAIKVYNADVATIVGNTFAGFGWDLTGVVRSNEGFNVIN